MRLTQEQLWKLRRQIVLGSLYYSDYINTFGIDRHLVCDFFDSFLSYVAELMQEDPLIYEPFFVLRDIEFYLNIPFSVCHALPPFFIRVWDYPNKHF